MKNAQGQQGYFCHIGFNTEESGHCSKRKRTLQNPEFKTLNEHLTGTWRDPWALNLGKQEMLLSSNSARGTQS